MQVAARIAIADDLGVVGAMAEAAIAEFTPQRGGAVWSQTAARVAPLDAGLRHELEDPDALVIVGTIDTTVVGYAACHVEPLHDGRAMARITDLYVLPDPSDRCRQSTTRFARRKSSRPSTNARVETSSRWTQRASAASSPGVGVWRSGTVAAKSTMTK